MTNVTSTGELYELLCDLSIPVLDEQGVARDIKDIIDDMLGSYAMCTDDQRRRLIDALTMLKGSGCEFSVVQKSILGYIVTTEGYTGETQKGKCEPKPKKRTKREPDDSRTGRKRWIIYFQTKNSANVGEG